MVEKEKVVRIAVPSGSGSDEGKSQAESVVDTPSSQAPKRRLEDTRKYGLGSFRYENVVRHKLLWSMLRISPSRITGKGRRCWIGFYMFLEMAVMGLFAYCFLQLYVKSSNMKSTYCNAPFIFTANSRASCAAGEYSCLLGADPAVVAAVLETYPRMCMNPVNCPEEFDETMLASEDLTTCMTPAQATEDIVICSNLDEYDTVMFPWCGNHWVNYRYSSDILPELNITTPPDVCIAMPLLSFIHCMRCIPVACSVIQCLHHCAFLVLQ